MIQPSIEERLKEAKKEFEQIKDFFVGQVIMVSELEKEVEGHKTYSFTKYRIKEIKLTIGIPNLIVEKVNE